MKQTNIYIRSTLWTIWKLRNSAQCARLDFNKSIFHSISRALRTMYFHGMESKHHSTGNFPTGSVQQIFIWARQKFPKRSQNIFLPLISWNLNSIPVTTVFTSPSEEKLFESLKRMMAVGKHEIWSVTRNQTFMSLGNYFEKYPFRSSWFFDELENVNEDRAWCKRLRVDGV